MFGVLRLAKRISENPKILIPIILLIAVAAVVDYVLIHPCSNPLPAQEDIQEVTYRPGWADADSPFRSFPMDKYRSLRENLEGAKRLVYSGTGNLTALLRILLKDGTEKKAKLFEYGLVSTEDGLFEGADDAMSNNLCSLMQELEYDY